MVIGSWPRLRAVNSEINVRIKENGIARADAVNSLGVCIHKNLAWHAHIPKLCKKVVSAIGALKHVSSGLIQHHFQNCMLRNAG